MKLCLILCGLVLSGCALKAIEHKSIVVPPSKVPTVVNAKATATSMDYFFYRTVAVQLEAEPVKTDDKK